MSRKLLILLSLMLVGGMFLSACGTDQGADEDGKISVYTSFFVLYDFAKKIGGDHVNVMNLVPAGVDAHDWTPGSSDLAGLNRSDIFIYNGLDFESWVNTTINTLPVDGPLVVEASHGIQLLDADGHHEDDDHGHGHEEDGHHKDDDHGHGLEEDGHHEDDDHGHGHEEDGHHEDDDHGHGHEEDGHHEGDDHGHGHEEDGHHEDDDHGHGHEEDGHHEDDDHGHGHEEDGHHEDDDHHGHDHGDLDPHVWLSPLNAIVMATNIKNALVQVDPVNAADYEANYEALVAELTALHEKFAASIAPLPRREIVVTHEAYAYLANEYGLTQIGILGLNPDAEPRAQDIQRISQFIQENNVQYIFFEELVSDAVANMLANDLKINAPLVLSPLEGVTEQQMRDGEDYFSLMERNLENIITALQ